jgi:hypothetical protein
MPQHVRRPSPSSCSNVFLFKGLFTRENIEEILNLQTKGSQAKPYQVRQVRQVLVKHQLGGSEDAEVGNHYVLESGRSGVYRRSSKIARLRG